MFNRFLLFLFIFCNVELHSQDLEWINQIKDVYDDIDVNDVVVDSLGNVYIGGSFDDQISPASSPAASSQINFMGTVQTTTHEQMGFLAKLNSNGTLLWMKKFGSTQSTTGYSPLAMAVKHGSLYVVGSFEYGTTPGLDFDPSASTRTIVSTAGNTDFFVSKYDCSTGNMVWAYAGFGTNGSDLPNGIVVDNSDNIYVSGQCNNGATPVDFNIKSPTGVATQIGTTSANQLYLVSYDKDCNFRWRKNITNSANNGYGSRELAIDLVNRYIYMAGGISQSSGLNPNFGGASLTVNASTKDGFLAKYDFSGNLQWVKNVASGTSDNVVMCVDVDGSGNVYVGGYFNGTADFDPSGTSNLVSAGSYDAFIAKYNSSGARQWSYRVGSSSFGEMISSIKVSSLGDIVVSGGLYGLADLNPEGTGGAQNKGAVNQRSIFFGQYDSDFRYKWAHAIGSSVAPTTTVGLNFATSIALDVNTSLYPVYVFGSASYLATQNFNPTGAGVFAPSLVPVSCSGISGANSWMGDNGFLAKYSTTNIVLPIELLSFQAACNQDKVYLQWETAAELNNSYFSVQRSFDGMQWNELGIVTGMKTSHLRNSYTYEDRQPLPEIAYYRLQQVDIDGQSKIYNTVYTNCKLTKDNSSIDVFPNPANQSIYIRLNEKEESSVVLKLYDVSGKLVLEHSMLHGNSNLETIDINAFASGLYILAIDGEKINQRVKIIKE